eukprot:3879672-Pleurochrysis_carterae.AAC.1
MPKERRDDVARQLFGSKSNGSSDSQNPNVATQSAARVASDANARVAGDRVAANFGAPSDLSPKDDVAPVKEKIADEEKTALEAVQLETKEDSPKEPIGGEGAPSGVPPAEKPAPAASPLNAPVASPTQYRI